MAVTRITRGCTHRSLQTVVAVRICNEDRSPVGIHSCDARGLPKARQENGSSPGHGGIYSAKQTPRKTKSL
jgi:hypothetical protein